MHQMYYALSVFINSKVEPMSWLSVKRGTEFKQLRKSRAG